MRKQALMITKKEFAFHYILNSSGIKTYFCDPASPWQKGSVEHANGITRRYIPFSMPYHQITQEFFDDYANKINNMPRKILGFETANEVFDELFNSAESRV